MKIHFVDIMPEVCFEHGENRNTLTGQIHFDRTTKDTNIYVLKGPKSLLIVAHELAHWVLCRCRLYSGHKGHKFIDKHFSVN